MDGVLVQLVLLLGGIPIPVLHFEGQHGRSHFPTFYQVFGGELLDDEPVFDVFLEEIGNPLLLLEFFHFVLELCSIPNLSVFEGGFVLVFGEGLLVGDGVLFFLKGKGIFPAEGLGEVEALIDLNDSGDGGELVVRGPLGTVEGAALGLGVPPVGAGEGVHSGELMFVEEGSITAMFDHNNYNKGWNHSVVAFADEGAQNDVREVLGDGVGVFDQFDHLDVEFPLALREFRLEHHEEVLPAFLLESYLLREGRHLARS